MKQKRIDNLDYVLRALGMRVKPARERDIRRTLESIGVIISKGTQNYLLKELLSLSFVTREFTAVKGSRGRPVYIYLYKLTPKGHRAVVLGSVGSMIYTPPPFVGPLDPRRLDPIVIPLIFKLLFDRGPTTTQKKLRAQLYK